MADPSATSICTAVWGGGPPGHSRTGDMYTTGQPQWVPTTVPYQLNGLSSRLSARSRLSSARSMHRVVDRARTPHPNCEYEQHQQHEISELFSKYQGHLPLQIKRTCTNYC
eukprot:4870630-Prymnesium_polylepis.1